MYVPAYILKYGVINTFGVVLPKIYDLLKSIYEFENTNVNQRLKKMDIKYHLELIESVISQFKNEETQDGETYKFPSIDDPENTMEMHPLILNIKYLSEIVSEIHNDLNEINCIVNGHCQKWFNNWRTLDIEINLINLENNLKILLSRFDDFIKLNAIYNHK